MKKNKHFFKLFWTYMLVIAVPLILVGFITLEVLFVNLENDTKNANMMMLEQATNIVDMNLKSVTSIPYQFNEFSAFRSLKYEDYTRIGELIYDIYETRQEFRKYVINEKLFCDLAIYCPKPSVVIGRRAYNTFAEFYDEYLQESKYSLEEWKEQIEKNEFIFVKSKWRNLNQDKDIVVYCRSMNTVQSTDDETVFLAVIDWQELLSIINFQGADHESGFAILDNNAQIVMQTDTFDTDKLQSVSFSERNGTVVLKNDMLIYKTSDIIPMKYVYSFQKHRMSGDVPQAMHIFMFLILGCFGISILLAILNSKKLSKSLLYIYNERALLLGNIEKQMQIERQNLLAELLHNTWNNPVESDRLEKYGLYLSKKRLCVIGVCVGNMNEGFYYALSEVKNHDAIMEISNFILQLLHTENVIGYNAKIENEKCFYILNFDDEAEQCGILEKIVNSLKNQYGIFIHIGVGETVELLTDLSRSYDGVMLALDANEGNEIVFFRDIKVKRGRVYYTKEKENSLVSSVKNNSVSGVERLMDEIYAANFEKCVLPHSAAKRLIFKLTMTIYKILDEEYADNFEKMREFDRVCRSLMSNENIEECFDVLREILKSLCSDKKRHNKETEWKERIEFFVEQNYNIRDISLQSMSDYFSVNYSYLSRLVKECMGVNFVTYLTMVRLEKSKELLLDTNLTVEQIAEQVGFGSVNTFVKIFKKYYLVTPGKFRIDKKF